MKVRFFAMCREKTGVSEREFELEDMAEASTLLCHLSRKYGGPFSSLDRLIIAVNGEYVRPDHILKDGDEVALIPPVSGGSHD